MSYVSGVNPSVYKALGFCKEVSVRKGMNKCIWKELLLISLFLVPEEKMYQHLKESGMKDKEIAEVAQKLLEELPEDVKDRNYNSMIETPAGEVLFLEDSAMDIFVKAIEDVSAMSLKGTETVIEVQNLIIEFSEMEKELYFNTLTQFLPQEQIKEYADAIGIAEHHFRIPNELSSFLTVLNDKFSKDEAECHICGREEETRELIKILMKMTKRNAILVGEAGVGKTALVEKFTWMIVTENCPDVFKSCIVLALDVNSIIAGTMYRGTAEERFKGLITFLENHPNCILFIDEVHLLLGAGTGKDSQLDLANALKPILARGDTRVIGATTNGEYEQYFSKDAALKRRFEKIKIEEPRTEQVYPMIQNQIKRLEKEHHTTISKELVDFVILNASCYHFETKNPDRTLDLLDKAMVCAQIEGREEVTKQDIINNFSVYQRKFDNLSEKQKRATAYHEAGHYIAYRFAPELVEYQILAISIMPTDHYLGVNVVESNPDITPSCTKAYFIQLIASYLAGRMAEKMYHNPLSAGASNDLMKATNLAKDIVLKYGLDEGFTQDRSFDQYKKEEINDALIANINERVNMILQEAKIYCEKLLLEEAVYLEAVAEGLLQHGILSAPEIEEIIQKVKEKKPLTQLPKNTKKRNP